MLMYSAVYKTTFAFMNRDKRLEDTEEETYLFLRTLSPLICFCYYSLLLIFFIWYQSLTTGPEPEPSQVFERKTPERES